MHKPRKWIYNKQKKNKQTNTRAHRAEVKSEIKRNAKASDTLQIGIVYALEEILKDVSRAKFTPTWSCGCAWWWTITWHNAHRRTEISQVLISVTSVVHRILLQVWQSYKSIHRGPQTESITKYARTLINSHCCPILSSCNRSMDTARSSCNWLSIITYWAVTNCSEISGTSWNQHNHNCDFIFRNKKKSHDVGLHLTWGGGGGDHEMQHRGLWLQNLLYWHSRQWHYSMKWQKAASLAVLSPSGKFRTSGHAFVWSLQGKWRYWKLYLKNKS